MVLAGLNRDIRVCARVGLSLIGLGLTLAGCTSSTERYPAAYAAAPTPPPPPPPPAAGGGTGRDVQPAAAKASPPEIVSLVRYVGADATTWPHRPAPSGGLDNYAGYSDLYTRFILTPLAGSETPGAGAGPPLRDYSQEERSWIERFLAKKTNSVIAVANITLMDPNLRLTVPLYTLTYASGGGVKNQWASSLTSSHVRSPLFRIEANSRAAIQLNTHVSTEVESRGLSFAMRAVTSAVSLAAPDAGILTKLSGEEANAKANALDSAVSTLLSSDIVEDIEIGRTVSSWTPSARVDIVGCAPFVRVEPAEARTAVSGRCATGKDLDKGTNQPIGRWELTLACPQFSVFSIRTVCDGPNIPVIEARQSELKRIAAAVVDSQILSFGLSTQINVRDYLRGRPWFTAFLARESPAEADYGSFCGLAMNDLQDQGLTGFDSALGLRALFRLMPEVVAKAKDSKSSPQMQSCRQLMSEYGVSL